MAPVAEAVSVAADPLQGFKVPVMVGVGRALTVTDVEALPVHPFEQTWMSYMFQKTIEGTLSPAMLLATPTEHNRFEFYDGSLRKES